MNIQLRHNEYQTDLSVEQIIAAALQNDNTEIELAISLPFDEDSASECDGDEAEEYDFYFERMVKNLSNHLGEPCYRSTYNSVDKKQWKCEICPTACADYLVVWPSQPKKLYIRCSQIDSEGEIVIAFGVEGCKCSRNTDCEYEYGELL